MVLGDRKTGKNGLEGKDPGFHKPAQHGQELDVPGQVE
jgi:hypothetical protein